MVLTLDNGQTVTIYEQNNVLKQLEPYIDKEIFDLLEEQYGDIDSDLERLDKLEDKIADQDEAYDSLEIDLDNLKDRYDDLYEEKKELENQNNKILSQIKDIVDKSRNNKLAFHEVENKLEEIWEEN
jgi:predicted  nucleic acid-binding Zn-ribbon protein